ncbi:acyl-CoA synthetase, AMP-forming [Geotalea daltonii FRC-32]|uniref:Acyl-CoA synthetase, AMP-forming n=2 Tax=Geotalea TaxID=2910589 RepID=B9M5L6_GEODF|nr:class I adenylate-forming enzyme family protein [Geotalea daltonii]ACM21775.1 acyl-CoA synthetase, AMP-forming [Geotalea daltonii FRC-32]
MYKSQTLIHHFLETNAIVRPVKIAFVHEDLRVNYFQINNNANQFAAHLMACGVSRGDRVVIFVENGLQYLISYYGTLKAGAVAVPLSTDMHPDRLKLLLNELQPGAIVTASRHENIFFDLSSGLEGSKLKALLIKEPSRDFCNVTFAVTPWEDIISNVIADNPAIPVHPDELASIVYTSGSTAIPKGVMLSHRNCVSNTHAIIQALRITESDIQMSVLPFHYVMGKSLVNTHFAAGGTVVVNNKFAFTGQLIEQMVKEQVTGFSGVPSSYAYLLQRSPLLQYRDRLGSLRYCSQAGGHMSRQLKEELLQVLPPHTKLYIMYGATEASARLTVLEHESLRTRIDSIGRPIAGVTLRVLDEQGRELPVGETGELVAAGPNIMQGYWKDSVHTANVLDDNGYHTGDLGYRDREGYYFVVGRKDNLLKIGGHRINPREIEEVMMSTGLLAEVAVVGVPDLLLGQRLLAVASPLEKGCSEKEILNRCVKLLPRYKLPAEVRLMDALPKTATAKIDYPKCAAVVQDAGMATLSATMLEAKQDQDVKPDVAIISGTGSHG